MNFYPVQNKPLVSFHFGHTIVGRSEPNDNEKRFRDDTLCFNSIPLWEHQ